MSKKIKSKDIKRFEDVINELNAVISDISKYNDDVNLYVHGEGCTSIHLMSKPYEGMNFKEIEEYKNSSVSAITINRCDCGGW